MVKVEVLKPSTPKNCIFIQFVDTNSHMTTKLHNCAFKCQSHSESYDQHGNNFRGGQIFSCTMGGFPNRESALGLTGWMFLYLKWASQNLT